MINDTENTEYNDENIDTIIANVFQEFDEKKDKTLDDITGTMSVIVTDLVMKCYELDGITDKFNEKQIELAKKIVKKIDEEIEKRKNNISQNVISIIENSSGRSKLKRNISIYDKNKNIDA